MQTLLLYQKQKAHEEGIWALTWVPRKRSLYTGSLDETIQEWQEQILHDSNDIVGTTHELVKKGESIGDCQLGTISLTTNTKGTWAAASFMDSQVRVWDTHTREHECILDNNATEVWQVALQQGPECRLLAAAGGTTGQVALWNLHEAKREYIANEFVPIRIDQSQEGQKAISYLTPNADTSSKKKDKFVLSVAFNSWGRQIASSSMDGQINIFDIESQQPALQLEGHSKPVRCLCFTQDGKKVLTACDDMNIHLYDAQNGTLIYAFSGHESWVLSVSEHPKGNVFASGGSDGKVKIWDVGSRQVLSTLADHNDQVWAVQFREDGQRLATGADDASLFVYSCQ
eukprot:TRINITY_DN36261_c0_g1_i2.p1 TRINITY_DN36261_c0_g1~~TRINITY_DN36261_c0_g1_i2.p1  ORF type:complete len:343 (+),score=30.42 TRINITY_DN36261_c0_g1_i2:59-1087(+)